MGVSQSRGACAGSPGVISECSPGLSAVTRIGARGLERKRPTPAKCAGLTVALLGAMCFVDVPRMPGVNSVDVLAVRSSA